MFISAQTGKNMCGVKKILYSMQNCFEEIIVCVSIFKIIQLKYCYIVNIQWMYA